MKVEPRGKYPGVKIHWDKEEVEKFMALYEQGLFNDPESLRFLNTLGRTIKKEREQNPKLLEERTPEEIAVALKKEEVAAREKQKVLAAGQDWTKVKVNVEVQK